MTVKADDDKNKTDNIVEIGGQKFSVNPAFKKALDAHTGELNTKVKTLEGDKQTLSERIASLSKTPVKGVQDDGAGEGDDDKVDFNMMMDDTEKAIAIGVKKTLKKLGIDPSKVGDTAGIEKKLELKQQQQKYWDDFYREHDYFSEDDHHFLVEGMARKLLPTIKDLPVKEGRKKIAEAVASMMGRAIKGGKLEIATESKHKVQNGMQLESADGSEVDNGGNADNTVTERTGTMSDIIRNSKRSPYGARKKGGKAS